MPPVTGKILGVMDLSKREKSLREVPLSTCLVASYPDELKNPVGISPWVSKEFQATMNYDYTLKSRDTIRLTVIENNAATENTAASS